MKLKCPDKREDVVCVGERFLSILMILRNHHSEYGKFYDTVLAPFAIKNFMLKVDVVYTLFL